jgi:hypothetical protein
MNDQVLIHFRQLRKSCLTIKNEEIKIGSRNQEIITGNDSKGSHLCYNFRCKTLLHTQPKLLFYKIVCQITKQLTYQYRCRSSFDYEIPRNDKLRDLISGIKQIIVNY